MKSIIYLTFFCTLTGFATQLNAQTYSIHQNNGFDPFTRELYKPGVNLHSSIKPYRLDEINNYYSTDSLIQRGLYKPSERVNIFKSNKEREKLNFFQRFIHDDLFSWEDKNDGIFIRINPLANFEIGKELSESKNIWVNTRGLMIEGNLGKNLSFYGDVYENQAVYPQYLDNDIRERYVVPGQGRAKLYGDDGRGFDFSQSNGYVSYNAGQWINLQLCFGKNFIGDGYRSLLLSDNANSYGHIKMTATFMKIKYWWMIAQFQHYGKERDFNHVGVDRFPYKYGAFHYLDWNIGKRISFGVFESVMWTENDEAGGRGVDLSYLNPFVFYRPIEFGAGSPDNMLVGANLKIIAWKDAALYGQLIFNEFKLDELRSDKKWWGNKYGFQIGLKSYNFLGINNLDAQTEYNQVRPYTYSHYGVDYVNQSSQKITYPVSNYYGHANQELMHPLGSNFKENVSILRYRYKRWHIELKNMIAIHGKDKNFAETIKIKSDPDVYKTWIVSYGGDIFKSCEDRWGVIDRSYGNEIGQGIKTNILNFSGEISWLVNPKTNMNIAIGGRYRKQSNEQGDNFDKYENVNKLFYITLRTSLRNFYYDF